MWLAVKTKLFTVCLLAKTNNRDFGAKVTADKLVACAKLKNFRRKFRFNHRNVQM
jgi:hypothetical protein